LKKFIIILFLIFITYIVYCQHIGIRANKELCEEERINNSLGLGIYINIDDFSEKIEAILSFDCYKLHKEYEDDDFQTYYGRKSIGLSFLYVIPIKEKLQFKTGLSTSYDMVNGSDGGIFTNWIHGYNAKFIGIEILLNLHLKNIFNFPLNFDLFITPDYLINIYNNDENKNSISKFYYDDNLKILQFQIGLTYKIK